MLLKTLLFSIGLAIFASPAYALVKLGETEESSVFLDEQNINKTSPNNIQTTSLMALNRPRAIEANVVLVGYKFVHDHNCVNSTSRIKSMNLIVIKDGKPFEVDGDITPRPFTANKPETMAADIHRVACESLKEHERQKQLPIQPPRKPLVISQGL